MFNSRWLFLAALMSCSAFAGVSFQQKQMKVESLMKLQKFAPAMAFEAYQRELEYEEQGLTTDERAKTETNLLADKIRKQVSAAYSAALSEHKSPELAREEVQAAIEKDLELAAPELKAELMELALLTLDSLESGGVSEEVELESVEQVMRKEVVHRREFLNAEPEPVYPKANNNKDSERKDYASRAQLMESLTSDRESSRWVSTASQTVKTGEITKTQSKISLQLKMEFLGATLEAGPVIAFKREFSSDAVIMTEGMHPVILRNGTFDLWKRDRSGKIIVKNRKPEKRYIAFFCDVDLKFETDYSGSGGFKYMGLGTESEVSRIYRNNVNIQSRRVALPESVAGKTMTVKYLSELCHNDFLKARFSDRMTVAQSLDVMMRNVVSGLVFSHSRTKCAQDRHCANWFKREVISLQKRNNTYRCAEDRKDKFRTCQLRGKVGQNCPVYERGKRTSSGQGEYACDFGLRCVKYEDAMTLMDWTWSYAKGRCQR